MAGSLTYIVAIFGSVLVWALKPIHALFAFTAIYLFFPQFTSIPIGGMNFTAGRIIILVFFFRILVHTRLAKSFKWSWLDTFVIINWVTGTLALLANVERSIVLQRESGRLVDTVLPYLAFRMVVRSKSDYIVFMKSMCWLVALMAIMALRESLTWKNPWVFMVSQYSLGELTGTFNIENYVRHGLFRASGSFWNYIGYGMWFAAIAPMLLSIFREKVYPPFLILVFAGLGVLGVVTTMSSGPLFSLVVAGFMVMAFPFRRYWRPFVGFIIICCVFLEFYSNRHFYVVPTRLAFNSATAYYRIGLYDEAFGGGMKGHWMFGYGYVGVGPGNDNTNFHWHYRDFTSIYIGRLVRHGLFGLLPFLVLPIIYYRYLYAAHQHAKRRRDKLLVYCFSAGLVGWSFGTLTVGFVAQTQTLFYMFMGIANNMPMMMEKIYGPIEKKRGRRGRRKRFEQELIQPEAATPTLTGETKGDTV